MTSPFFSVVIPTFRRPELLKAALQSTLRQTHADFEVVISNDDAAGSDSWKHVGDVVDSDSRVRVVFNTADRGQVGNTNNGIRHARGQWIKLLHDDDLLHPSCLARFHHVLSCAPESARMGVACCRSDTILKSGDIRLWKRRSNQPVAELIPARHIVLAMYLQEDIGESLPSSICINRKLLVDAGAWMPQRNGFVSVVDTHWAILLAPLGDRLVINEALVAKRQEPDSITGRITDDVLDREFEAIRELQYQAIPAELGPPPLALTLQSLAIRRAAHRLVRRRRPLEAAAIAVRAWDPRAWLMAATTTLSRRFPTVFTKIPRTAIRCNQLKPANAEADYLQQTEASRGTS